VNPVTGTEHTSVDIGVNADLELVDKFCYLGDMLSVDGDADAAVENRIRIGWNKFRQLVPTNKDISLIVRGRLYSGCVRSSMAHGSETWPVRKENEVALQQAEIRMVRWMYGVKLQDRVPSKGYGHVFRKEDNDWMKKYGVLSGGVPGQEVDQRKLGERLWKKDCQAHKLNREDAMDHIRWMKQITDD